MDRADLIARIDAHPLDGDVASQRAAFHALADLPPVPFDGEERDGELGGVTVRRIEPSDARAGGPVLVWLHGGGYVVGSPASHANLVRTLAQAAGVACVVPRYPLAPESPWPAQRDAARTVLDAVHRELRDDGVAAPRVFLGGDSAGGHLAIVTALVGDTAPPAGLVLLSPNTLRDYTLSETRRANASRDAMNDPDDDDAFARLAFGRIDPHAPEQTLVHAPLARLPPLYLDVGTDEVLLDDSLVLARAAARRGVAVSLHVDPGGFHLRQLFAGAFAPGTRSLERAARWLRAQVGADDTDRHAS